MASRKSVGGCASVSTCNFFCTPMALVAVVATLIVLSILLSCATNPVTGKRELMLVTESDEVALGAQSDQGIIQTYGAYNDPDVADYFNKLGQNMCKVTQRSNLEYHFQVLDTPVVNAFAGPGGYVYVTRGILAYLNDEAELAGVLGHELGHVSARHVARQLSRQQLTQLGLGVGMIVSEKFRQYAGLAQFGAGMLFLKFSRDDERQADDLAVEYSSKSGYDAHRMAAFFQTLERMNSGGGTGLPDWFSTHPNPANRVAAVDAKATEWNQKLGLAEYKIKRDDYLKLVDGIVYGDDPRQGYVEDGVFYHPTMTFTFPVPSGWQLTNTPAQVQIVTEEGDAAILLMLDDAGSISKAADKFVTDNGASTLSREKLTVNGLQAERVVARLVSDSDTLQTMSYFIAKGDNIFALHGLTRRSGYSKYSGTFSKTFGGFKNLTDASKINVQPERLAVKKVTKAGSLGTVLTQLGVAESQLEDMAILNGMQLKDNVSVGTLIKTVVK
jgi:predicted Zn-dependent protease